MKQIAKFEKVSLEQFRKDYIKEFGKDEDKDSVGTAMILCNWHSMLNLPKRATNGSAGYDFYFPMQEITLRPNETIKFPTGIRVRIEDGWVLKCYPRSSLGFKYRLQLNNTVGIIDSDYYYSDNEGHISQRSQMIPMKISQLP